jgi:hypothetical protein
VSDPLQRPSPRLPPGKQWTWKPAGIAWLRVYHRDPHTPEPTFRRRFGPKHRFDHHRGDYLNPSEDPDRSILYLAKDLPTGVIESFPNRRAFICPNYYAAELRTLGTGTFQELREGGAVAIGAMPELSTGSVLRPLSQEWARAIYDQHSVVGLHYTGAHDEGECLAVWDRAPALEVVTDQGVSRDMPLREDEFWERLEAALPELGWSLKRIGAYHCPACRRHGLH